MTAFRSMLALPALALAFSLAAPGQSMKIAIIDMQGSLLSTKDGQKAADELKTKFGPKETEFNKRQQDLVAKQEQYRKTQSTMSDQAKANADRDIAAATKALQRDADDTKADFQTEENRLLGGILNKMQAVLTKYAADNQITMIVDLSQQSRTICCTPISLSTLRKPLLPFMIRRRRLLRPLRLL